MRRALTPVGGRKEIAHRLDDELVIFDLPEAGDRNRADDTDVFDVDLHRSAARCVQQPVELASLCERDAVLPGLQAECQ